MKKDLAKKLDKIVGEPLRRAYLRRKRKKLINKTPTVIASDCFGTFIYHDMNLKFLSPTINLYFSTEDFIKFAKNLSGYLSQEVVEVIDETKPFPVGKLTFDNLDVYINFMHYKTFEEAKAKWNERKERVDFSNLFITLISPKITNEQAKEFLSIPHKNKMLITCKNNLSFEILNDKHVYTHPIFEKENYLKGEILRYPKWYSKKRTVDDIDYVTFLNNLG